MADVEAQQGARDICDDQLGVTHRNDVVAAEIAGRAQRPAVETGAAGFGRCRREVRNPHALATLHLNERASAGAGNHDVGTNTAH